MASSDGELNRFVLFCALVASLTSFSFGYHSGVINQPRDAMTNCTPVAEEYPPNCLPMNDWQWGTFVSMYLFGGIFGALSGGHWTTSLGRRRTIFYNNIVFLLGGVCMALGPSTSALTLGRFIVGVAAGIGTVAVPMYISEISPVEKRGTLGTFNQLGIVVGILFSVLIGIQLATREGWRTMFWWSLAAPIIQLCLLPFCVETPAWLSSQALARDSRDALRKLRGVSVAELDEAASMLQGVSPLDVEVVTESPISSPTPERDTKALSFSDTLKSPQLRNCLTVAVCLHTIQQFSGINVAIYYSTTIFQQSYSPNTAIALTVLISVVNLIMTGLSTVLIDRLGRKTLLLTSELGMAVCATGTVLATKSEANPGVLVALLVAFVGMFAIGLGAVPWLILPELVPTHAVGPAASLGTGVNWSSAFIVALISPPAIAALGYDVFLVFAAILFASAAFTFKRVPETKGQSPEAIERAFALHSE
ncbi:hypothetical protein HDU85_007136 [Gaertneriomyces sp. JEL0708]|nr:hypothetical protein HDU85_007136 [Gaertneriomyces sp. JEL0708]